MTGAGEIGAWVLAFLASNLGAQRKFRLFASVRLVRVQVRFWIHQWKNQL